jgi:biopolymer transport protein ExbD
MNFRSKQRDEPEVSLTPLIDVVFLLLIFFMVSTTFRKESEFRIELPEATQQAAFSKPEGLEIVIDVRGHYAINNQVLTDTSLATLKTAILGFTGNSRDMPVMIRADAQTEHQAVVKVMDAVGQLGFHQLSIATVHRAADQDNPAPAR